MANYIGNEPLAGEFKRLDSIESQFNGSLTSFNLLFNSLATSAGDASTLFVSLNGIIQEPIEAYTLTNGGSKIVFSSAPATGAECYIVQMGSVGGTATPSDASVTHGKFHTSVGAIVPSALGTAGQVLTVNPGATAATFADAGGGASEYSINNKTTAYTVVSSDLGKILNYTSGTVDVTLTALSSLNTGFHVSIWNSGTGVISIKPNSADGIGVSAGNDYDDSDPYKLQRGTGVTLVNSGTYWQIYSEKAYDYYHHSVTLGSNATVDNNHAMALGHRSFGGVVGSIAIGTGQGHATTATGTHSIAMGLSTATGANSVALGKSRTGGQHSFAAVIDNNTTSYGTGANGHYSAALGSLANVTGQYSFAFGRVASALGGWAYALGQGTQASGSPSHVLGHNSSASAGNSISIGTSIANSTTNSIVIGGTAQQVKISNTYTLPIADGTNGQVLTTNGSGVSSWATASGGGGGISISTKTADYTLTSSDDTKVILYNSSSSRTLTFPAASTVGANFSVTVTNKGTGLLTLTQNGSETLDLVNLKNLQGYWHRLQSGSSITIFTDGSNWFSKSVSGKAGNQIGVNAKASGTYSAAFGLGATAQGQSATAIGHGAFASGNQSQAFGSASAASAGTAVGYQSVCSSSYGISLGYARAGGSDSFAGTIANNTSSYGTAASKSAAIGNLAKATGTSSVCISNTSIASGSNAAVLGGSSGTASGSGSVALGGSSNVADATYSTAKGYYGNANGIRLKHATGVYPNQQGAYYVLGHTTSDATPIALNTDVWTPSATNQIILPNNSAYSFSGTIIARENASASSDYASWEIKGALLRDANAASTVLGNGIQNKLYATSGASAWAIALTADTTFGGLKIEVTGAASTNIRWVATVNTSEVTYA